MKEHVSKFPEPSYALTLTVVVNPIGNSIFGALSYVIFTGCEVSLSVATASNLATGSFCNIFCGHTNLGASVSGKIVTLKVQDKLRIRWLA